MAETPRHWQRQFKSTMIPSTPCTLPELACQPVHLWIYPIYIFFLFKSICPIPRFPSSLSPCSLFFILTLHFLNLHQSGSWRGIHLHPNVQQALFHGTISNQRSQSSRPFNQQSSTANPQGFTMHKREKREKTKTNHTHLRVEPLFCVCFCFFYLNVCTHVFVRYTERESGQAQTVPAQLFSSPS